MAADWTADAVRQIGGRRLNKLLQMARQGIFSGPTYRAFADMITHATDKDLAIIHTQWESWGNLIAKYHLFEIADLQGWATLILNLDSKGIRAPWELQRMEFPDLNKAGWQLAHPDMLFWLWQAARQESGPGRGNLPFAVYTPQPDFQRLILSLRTDHIDQAEISARYREWCGELGLPANFEGLTNAGKCAELVRAGANRMDILRFLNLSAQRNTIRAFAGSLRPVASGMQNYKNFREFPGRPPFQVGSDTILLWGGLFRPWKTFGPYVSHVAKATIILRFPTDWLNESIRSVARGLRKVAGQSFKFGNYVAAPDLLTLLKRVKLSPECGLAAFLSFLLLPRVPSETLLMRMASDTDRISEYCPRKFEILVGVRTIGGSELLIAKFAWRKNTRRGVFFGCPA